MRGFTFLRRLQLRAEKGTFSLPDVIDVHLPNGAEKLPRYGYIMIIPGIKLRKRLLLRSGLREIRDGCKKTATTFGTLSSGKLFKMV